MFDNDTDLQYVQWILQWVDRLKCVGKYFGSSAITMCYLILVSNQLQKHSGKTAQYRYYVIISEH